MYFLLCVLGVLFRLGLRTQLEWKPEFLVPSDDTHAYRFIAVYSVNMGTEVLFSNTAQTEVSAGLGWSPDARSLGTHVSSPDTASQANVCH